MRQLNLGNHHSHCRNFGLQERSTELEEQVEHRVHTHQRWQEHRSPFAGSGIGQATGLAVRRSHLADHRSDPAIAEP